MRDHGTYPTGSERYEATIAWSYNLLSCAEQRLFTCLGVFAGGFTEDAAGFVCDGVGLLEIDMPDGLESLVEHNLLRRIWGGKDGPRYEMLETIHEYALQQLTERGDGEAARRAAVEYYVGLAERADLRGGGQMQWVPRLAADQDNFRAALAWCRERGQHGDRVEAVHRADAAVATAGPSAGSAHLAGDVHEGRDQYGAAGSEGLEGCCGKGYFS